MRAHLAEVTYLVAMIACDVAEVTYLVAMIACDAAEVTYLSHDSL